VARQAGWATGALNRGVRDTGTGPSLMGRARCFVPLKGWRSGDGPLKRVGGSVATVPLLALIFILATLVYEAVPAIRLNGPGFLTRLAWNPGNFYGGVSHAGGVLHPDGASYGAFSLIVGTLLSSAIALVLAVPLSVGAALTIVEKLPPRLSSGVGFFLEVLAGIPSVVYGLWGVITLGPLLANYVTPFIARHLPDVPVLSWFKGNVGHGEGLLTSSIVLAIMVVPIVAATTRDLLRQVPALPKEGAIALGMSDWEVSRRVSLPWVASGIVGASVLGLARALGETMAVAMVSGAVVGTVPSNIYATFTTIAATIVSQLDSALTDATGFAVSSLAEAALVLLVITLLANVGARLLVRRVATSALPVGRGV
jgi:phosphate transport system permease protein